MQPHKRLANAIRALSIDAVQKAQSGHPGAPMGMADIAEVLWRQFLVHDPKKPKWYNRDRFILSNGHASMLLYSLLHLSGYDLSIEDIKSFRQFNAKTAGHPEYNHIPGIETTTGPLGQGLVNAVGMAIAQKNLAATFNRPSFPIIDHYTYVFVGDGCLMEGISHEACSLAGSLKLNKLIVFYDDNGISIDGEVSGWFTDDTPKRFESYHWHVIRDVDGHNPTAVEQAILEARSITDKPTLICCKTIIGYGSPHKAGSASCHGAPLGADEVIATKKSLGWDYQPFEIPDDIYKAWNACEKGEKIYNDWYELWQKYQNTYPDLAQELARRLQHQLPEAFLEMSNNYIAECQQAQQTMASRHASQHTLNAYGPLLPELIGGSADLAGSNMTLWSESKVLTAHEAQGNYINYGVREFAMSAIMNGLSLYGGFIPYGGTFLIFMEYACNAVRMAALMQQRVIFIYTHDSIGLGEDGPTHQPIEQLTSLRAVPGIRVWRPADTTETAVAWQQAILEPNKPSALVLSRQKLPCLTRNSECLSQIQRGGYIIIESTKEPDILLIGYQVLL